LADQSIRFDNGAAYERYMGVWSQLVAETFLGWLAPKPGLRWLDVGCGNGAFTETIVGRCAPSTVKGIDPSEGQLSFARTRPALRDVEFLQADAMALPYADNSLDVAVMPLVIFFVPDPVKGVDEMKRVVSPGGIVSAYSWDMIGGGFPYDALHDEMRTMGVPAPMAPSLDASKIDVMQELWTKAGFESVETQVITVQRTFSDFEEYWTIILGGPSVKGKIEAMTPVDIASLKVRMRARLPIAADGRITYSARANAIKGCVKNKS
jgi:ubiquinone/menaquinone biosynthesis C-methylase UbiE